MIEPCFKNYGRYWSQLLTALFNRDLRKRACTLRNFASSARNYGEDVEVSAGSECFLVSRFAKFIQRLRNSACVVLAFFSKLSLQRERTILMYHSVGSNGDFYTVAPEEFGRQVDYLKRSHSILSLDEMVECINNSRKLPRKSVAITFDDGYRDCYLNAYPYLRRNNLPATIFVSTAYVGKEWPFSNPRLKMLDWNEIEEMSKNNIAIGSHTATHPDLREADLETARNEILESKMQIEEHIKKTVKHFSFPFGRCSQKTVALVKSMGFESAMGDPSNCVGRKSSGVSVLGRVQVDSSVPFILFKARLTKSTPWLRQLERIVKKMREVLPT